MIRFWCCFDCWYLITAYQSYARVKSSLMERKTKAAQRSWFSCSELQLNEATTQMQSEPLANSPQSARIEPIKRAAYILNAQSIPHKSHLRQLSQFRPLPSEFIKYAVVEGMLLLTAATQFFQTRKIQAGPVLGEGLGTVPLDLPRRQSAERHMNQSQICKCGIKICQNTHLELFNTK